MTRTFTVKKSAVLTFTVTLNPAKVEVNGKLVADVPVIAPGEDPFIIDVAPHFAPGTNRITLSGIDKPIRQLDEQEDFDVSCFLDGEDLSKLASSEQDFEQASKPDNSFVATILVDYRGSRPPAAKCSLVFISVDDQARVTVDGTTVHTQSLLRHNQPRSTLDLGSLLKPGLNTVEILATNAQHFGDLSAELTLDDKVASQWRRVNIPAGPEQSIVTFQLSSGDKGVTLTE